MRRTSSTRSLGRELAVLKGHEYDVNDASFSPDGTRVVTASSDHSIRVWDAGTGAEIAKMTGHLGGATSVDLHAGRGCTS